MDSLFPFLQGLAPLQHVGLSRRTVNHRQSGSDVIQITLGKYRPLTDLDWKNGLWRGRGTVSVETAEVV
jgi:hypothetical protein